jgi:hypothetical protein
MSIIGFSYTAHCLTLATQTCMRREPMMSGETSLNVLLRSMSPQLNPGEYVFASVPEGSDLQRVQVLGSFREREGLTVIIERQEAESLGLASGYVMAWITLNVHSSLEAVGLTAAFATALGKAGISCNVIAGFYHDHLFVGKDDAQKAMTVLGELASSTH